MMRCPLLPRCGFFLCAFFLLTEVAAQQQVTHSVLRKETAYGIAKSYGVDLNALYDLNPWAEGGIRKGDVLRIPMQPNASQEVDPPSAEEDVRQPAALDSILSKSLGVLR